MAWVRIDDHAPEHPKLLRAGRDASWMWVQGLAYCSRNLTDGEIPREAVEGFAGRRSLQFAAQLVDVGLWKQTETGFRVHDYLDYNPSADQVAAKRKATTERVQNWKATHGHVGKKRTSNAATNAPVTALPTRSEQVINTAPDPDPDPQEERTAATPPPAPVEDSIPGPRDLSGFVPPKELAPFTVVSALVRGLLAEQQDFHYPGGEADLLDMIKTRCAKARLGYNSELVRKALDSERAKPGHRRSA